MEKASDRFECVDYIEKDKYAVKSYNAIFKEEHEPKDATKIQPKQLPDFELLCAGFPCQAFSIAGNRGGFEDTRGTLFFEIARITREKLPKILLLENVKGLLNHADGQTFRKILETLDELGYDAEWQVLNSKYHGVPQNRERVFIIGHLRGETSGQVFPFYGENGEDSGEDGGEGNQLKTIHDNRPEIGEAERIYDNDGVSPTVKYNNINITHPAITEAIGRGGSSSEYLNSLKCVSEALFKSYDNYYTKDIAMCLDKNYFKGMDNRGQRTHVLEKKGEIDQVCNYKSDKSSVDNPETGRVYSSYGISPTLNTMGGGDREPKIVYNELRGYEFRSKMEGVSPTLVKKIGTGGNNTPMIFDNLIESSADLTPGRINKRQPKIINHQMRPESRPSIEDEGQSGGSGILFNEEGYSYTISKSPHYVSNVQPVITPDFKDKDMNKKSPIGSQDGNMFTVDGTSIHGVTDGVRIRKLTPRECWRLQGFPDWAFEKAQKENSDTQLYKQAGNAVTVNVIEDIGKRLVKY